MTAKDLALRICDIYSNSQQDIQALDEILVLCKKIIENDKDL